MKTYFSIFEAKAKFSELVRLVLSQGQVVITQRGVPVIKLLPYRPEATDINERLESLAAVGRARLAKKAWPRDLPEKAVKVSAGAVERFLADRQ